MFDALNSDVKQLMMLISFLASAFGWLATRLHSQAMQRLDNQDRRFQKQEENQAKLITEISLLTTSVAVIAKESANFEKEMNHMRVEHSETRRSLHDNVNNIGGLIHMNTTKVERNEQEISNLREKMHVNSNDIQMFKGKILAKEVGKNVEL